MKAQFQCYVGTCVAALMFLGLVTASSAPPEKKSKAAAPLAESNAIPQSVFTIPTNPKQGRDPFFPNSTRLPGGASLPVHSSSSHSDVTLVLKGLSGAPDHRLAIINDRTLAEGEESEINTSAGRVRIRCLQIRGEVVVVEVGGERRELRLRE